MKNNLPSCGRRDENNDVCGETFTCGRCKTQLSLNEAKELLIEFAPYVLNHHRTNHWGFTSYGCDDDCLGRQAEILLGNNKEGG